MNRDEMANLVAFAAVAEERSFTRASTKLGISQSALSQIVRRLEASLGLRLLTRTTRSVAPTEAGEKILQTLSPSLNQLDECLMELSDVQNRPSGSLRINTVEHAAKTVICPALSEFLTDHPDVSVELVTGYELVDIVADRFDAGVRLGEQVANDMISVRISADIPMAIVGSPQYFSSRPKPREPRKLLEHRCINLRLPTSGGVYEWRFRKDGRSTSVRVEGAMILDSIDLILDMAVAGLGLAYLPLDQVDHHIKDGSLIKVLGSWTEPLPGYHLYYPDRRYKSSAFRLLIERLRFR